MVRAIVVSLIAIVASGCTMSVSTGGSTNQPSQQPTEEDNTSAAPTTTQTATKPPPRRGGSRTMQKGNKLQLPGAIHFETGKAAILPDSEGTLNDLKTYLDDNQQVTLLRIEGHTDNTGQSASNLALSGERAKSVRTWLVNKGIASSRLVAVGFGDTKPIADNNTAAGKEQNRRTEFTIVQVNGRAYQGADRLGGGTEF